MAAGSWTTKQWGAHRYKTREKAEEALARIDPQGCGARIVKFKVKR